MSPLLASVLRDVATMLCVTALAIAHVIPGSTAVALIAPYLALRVLMGKGPPGPGGGAGPTDLDLEGVRPTLPSGPPLLRRVLALLPRVLAPVSLVLPVPLDAEHLLVAGEHLRQRLAGLVERVELLAWQARGALALALRSPRRA